MQKSLALLKSKKPNLNTNITNNIKESIETINESKNIVKKQDSKRQVMIKLVEEEIHEGESTINLNPITPKKEHERM